MNTRQDKLTLCGTIFATFMLAIVSSIGLFSLEFKGEFNIFFEKDDPYLVAFESMQETYTKNTNITIIVSPQEKDVFNKNTLGLIVKLTEEAWKIPYSIRVDSLTNFQHARSNGEELLAAPLVANTDLLQSVDMQALKSIVKQQPELINRLVSADNQSTIVNITVEMPGKNQEAEVAEVYTAVAALTADYARRHPDYRFYHTGEVAINHAFSHEAKHDFGVLVPAMFLCALLVVYLSFRSVKVAIAFVIAIGFSILSALGLAGATGFFMSVATINAPIIIMAIVTANSVHIVASIYNGLAQSMQPLNAAKYAISNNLRAVTIANLTTGAGFLLMNFSEVPVLRDLGNVCAMGVMYAFVYSMFTLPALLVIFRLTPKRESQPSRIPYSAIVVFIDQWRRQILVVGIAMFVVSLYFMQRNVLNDDQLKYFSHKSDFGMAVNHLEAHYGGMATVGMSILAGEEQGVNDIDYLRFLDNYVKWLRQQPEVDHVYSYVDTIKRINRNMHDDAPEWNRIPETSEMASQYLLIYEMSLPFGLDLNNQLSFDRSGSLVVITLENIGSKGYIEFERKAFNWIEEQKVSYRVEASSPALMMAHVSARNMKSMLISVAAALIMISILLVVALKSIRLGLISLVPNLIPPIIGFGLWGAFSGQINLGLSVVATMCLGIIVDDTVHFLDNYRKARDSGEVSVVQALEWTFRRVGHPIVVTTVALVLGFLILTLSTFRLNSEMGLLTAVIMLIALLLDLLLLPAILLTLDRKRS